MRWREKVSDFYKKDGVMNIFEEKRIRVSDAVLALDLDGTLTNSKKEVTSKTKKAIDTFIEKGGVVILASGRPTYGVMPVAKMLELKEKSGYILSFNGGCFFDCRNNKELFVKVLNSSYLPILEKQAKKYNVNLLTYNDDKAVVLDPDEHYFQIEVSINHLKTVKADPLLPEITFPVIKCMMTAPGEHLAQVEKEMKKYWLGKLNIVRSEPYFLEITAEGIDKARTLLHMIKKIGKDAGNLICCGDGYNDISMLRSASIGVAMANAHKKVKEAANYITNSNDEDGIADVIENLFDCDK